MSPEYSGQLATWLVVACYLFVMWFCLKHKKH